MFFVFQFVIASLGIVLPVFSFPSSFYRIIVTLTVFNLITNGKVYQNMLQEMKPPLLLSALKSVAADPGLDEYFGRNFTSIKE